MSLQKMTWILTMLSNSLQFKIAQKMQSEHESLQQYPPLDVCYMLFKNYRFCFSLYYKAES